jgi:large subunit ribosomal protein L4
MVLEALECKEPKTKLISALLGALQVDGKKNLLIVDGDGINNVYLSGRNIKNLDIKPLSEINALDVIGCENIIFGGETLIGKVEEVVAL